MTEVRKRSRKRHRSAVGARSRSRRRSNAAARAKSATPAKREAVIETPATPGPIHKLRWFEGCVYRCQMCPLE